MADFFDAVIGQNVDGVVLPTNMFMYAMLDYVYGTEQPFGDGPGVTRANIVSWVEAQFAKYKDSNGDPVVLSPAGLVELNVTLDQIDNETGFNDKFGRSYDIAAAFAMGFEDFYPTRQALRDRLGV